MGKTSIIGKYEETPKDSLRQWRLPLAVVNYMDFDATARELKPAIAGIQNVAYTRIEFKRDVREYASYKYINNLPLVTDTNKIFFGFVKSPWGSISTTDLSTAINDIYCHFSIQQSTNQIKVYYNGSFTNYAIPAQANYTGFYISIGYDYENDVFACFCHDSAKTKLFSVEIPNTRGSTAIGFYPFCMINGTGLLTGTTYVKALDDKDYPTIDFWEFHQYNYVSHAHRLQDLVDFSDIASGDQYKLLEINRNGKTQIEYTNHPRPDNLSVTSTVYSNTLQPYTGTNISLGGVNLNNTTRNITNINDLTASNVIANIQTNNITEVGTAGVNIEGVLIKDNNVSGATTISSTNLTGNIQTNNITEIGVAGVNIEGVLIKDNNVSGVTTISATTFSGTHSGNVQTNNITEIGAAGVNIEGILIKDNNVSGATTISATNLTGNIQTNSITEIGAAGVNIEGVLIKDNNVSGATTISATNLSGNIQTNNITEIGAGGVNIEGVFMKDNNITTSGLIQSTASNVVCVNTNSNGVFTNNILPLSGYTDIAFAATNNNFSGNIKVNNISEYTASNGVYIGTIRFLESLGNKYMAGLTHLNVNNINDTSGGVINITATNSVNIESVNFNGQAISNATSINTNSVITDTISEKTANGGVTCEGILLKDNNIVTSGTTECGTIYITNVSPKAPGVIVNHTAFLSDFSGGVKTNNIYEHSADAGVFVDGVYMKDNQVNAIEVKTNSLQPYDAGTYNRIEVCGIGGGQFVIGVASTLYTNYLDSNATGTINIGSRITLPLSTGGTEKSLYFKNDGLYCYFFGSEHRVVPNINHDSIIVGTSQVMLSIDEVPLRVAGQGGVTSSTTHWQINTTNNMLGVVSGIIRHDWNLTSGVLKVWKGLEVDDVTGYIQSAYIKKAPSGFSEIQVDSGMNVNGNMLINGTCKATKFISDNATTSVNAGGAGNTNVVTVNANGNIYTVNLPSDPKEVISSVTSQFTMTTAQETAWLAANTVTDRAQMYFNVTEMKAKIRDPVGFVRSLW